MYRFQIIIHGRHDFVTRGAPVTLGGERYASCVPPAGLAAPLAQLPRMFVELDGSFVWVAEKEETRDWQLDGNLQDRNERLLLVDVKGTCPSNQFDRLLRCIGWPATRLIFQLVREAVFLDEEEFRRYAAAQAHVVS